MLTPHDILAAEYWNNTVEQYLWALAGFVGLYLVFHLFQTIVVLRLRKAVEDTETDLDDKFVSVVGNISGIFYLVISLYFPLRYLVTSPSIEKIFNGIFVIVVVYQAIVSVQSLISYFLIKSAKKAGGRKEEAVAAVTGINFVVRLLLWFMGLLLILSNLGVNINSLVASLGIGGVAVALAVQNILGDIFSSFSIYFDKPFKAGDYIKVGDHEGTVKKIGLKTTRLEALQGEEIVISNKELTSSRVQNYKRMNKRRIPFRLGLVYGTPVPKLKKVNQIIKKVIDGVENTEFSRVHFREFGDFSLNFEVVYYVLSRDYGVFMDVHEQINLGIAAEFKKAKIEMAFPTQTVHVKK